MASRIGRSDTPNRLRIRLTLMYGALSVISGAVLLGITYTLFDSLSGQRLFVEAGLHTRGDAPLGTPPPGSLQDLTGVLQDQAARQHDADLDRLLLYAAVALAIMAVVSLLIGWLVAGRVLRPVLTMTTSLHQISARNLHERLDAEGPRNELKDLSDTIDGLLGRLETSLGAHQRFVANAAHELRTPLTVERALLEEPLIDPDADVESFRSNFTRLLAVNEQQARLLESLLTLAGTERGLERREPVDLAAVVRQVSIDCAGAARDRGVEVVTTSTATAVVPGDEVLLGRLVMNLVDNAINYNHEGGRVEVAIRAAGDHVALRVANTGPPVPPEAVDRLFDPFQRLDRVAGDTRHQGLGLSIVRAIVAAHHGVIGARAVPGGGLEIEIDLPLTLTPETTARPAVTPIRGIPVRAGR